VDNGPLVKEEIDAGRELVRRLDRYRPVKAAFWLKASDDPYRYLYIASERIEGASLELGYPQIIQVMRELQSPDLDGFRIKVVAADNPLAREAVETAERFPMVTGRRQGGRPFGDLFADDLYIYPLPLPAVA